MSHPDRCRDARVTLYWALFCREVAVSGGLCDMSGEGQYRGGAVPQAIGKSQRAARLGGKGFRHGEREARPADISGGGVRVGAGV